MGGFQTDIGYSLVTVIMSFENTKFQSTVQLKKPHQLMKQVTVKAYGLILKDESSSNSPLKTSVVLENLSTTSKTSQGVSWLKGWLKLVPKLRRKLR